MGLVDFLQSKKGKKIMAFLYGWGAAVVIVGAMFKIQHWPGAGAMLVAGLTTEAVIFFFSAFEPIHEDVDWSLVYPELAHTDEPDHEAIDAKGEEVVAEIDNQGTITEQLDNMLEEAKIGPDLIESLGDGLRGLSDQTQKLSNITDASLATQDYVDNLKDASNKVGELSEKYEQASESLGALSMTAEDGKAYSEQMQKVAQNLSALNNVYEMQLQSAQEQSQNNKEMYDNMSAFITNLRDSVEDTQLYKENISELAQNLSKLNTVYGNMLSAMSVGGNNNG